MQLFNFYSIFIFLSYLLIVDSYKILGVFPFNGKSHFMMFERLMKGLALRGHRVDVISHFPLKNPIPNYNDIINLSGTLPAVVNNLTYEFGTILAKKTMVSSIATQFGGDICDLMGVPQFKEFLENPSKHPPYDIIITEIFGSTCYLALGKHLNTPIVGVVTSPMWPWANDMVANPDNPAYIHHVLSGLVGNLSFWQRVKNTLTLLESKWEFNAYSAYQDEKIKKYLGPDAQSLKDAERNVSLILVNTHYSLQGVRPFTTAVVEVGGLHINESETKLTKNIKKWLDDSEDGFVFLSFGSLIKLESLPKKTLAALCSSLAKLTPVRVLMKLVNIEELSHILPSNVLALPWVPQIAVLQHKNIRAFMTHGGLMGTQEAVYFGVPMIGVPLFGDQLQNVKVCVEKNISILLTFDEITEEKLDAAFNAVLNDPSYMKAAKKLSAEFKDRPMPALDTAIFWIEYVIRRGGNIIRSPAMDLKWWQIALLDVYGIFFLTIVIVLYLLKIFVNKILRLILGNNSKRSLKLKKK